MGHTYFGGADIMECLKTAANIIEGDDESWYREWTKTADRVYAMAAVAESSGRFTSAAGAYLRASNYYRNADFFIHGDLGDPRIVVSGRKSRDSFEKAARHLDYKIEKIRIPYEKTFLPGYFIKSPQAREKAPLLIVHSGFDGTKEEVAVYPGFAAVQRGYHVLVFDGPGQGEVIREQGLTFRPDWEAVITPVVDYALTRADVDGNSIAYMGIIMGGLLAPRAAAHEHRIKALIANSGLYSFFEGFADRMHGATPLAFSDPAAFNAIVTRIMPDNTTLRWIMNNGRMVFGAMDAAALVRRLKDFDCTDAPLIRATTLIIEGENDLSPGQADKLFKLNRAENFPAIHQRRRSRPALPGWR
jgi:hypothetical protein